MIAWKLISKYLKSIDVFSIYENTFPSSNSSGALTWKSNKTKCLFCTEDCIQNLVYFVYKSFTLLFHLGNNLFDAQNVLSLFFDLKTICSFELKSIFNQIRYRCYKIWANRRYKIHLKKRNKIFFLSIRMKSFMELQMRSKKCFWIIWKVQRSKPILKILMFIKLKCLKNSF